MKHALLVALALCLVPALASAQQWAILTPLRANADTTWLEVHVMVDLPACGYTVKPCPLGALGGGGVQDSCRHSHEAGGSVQTEEMGDDPPFYLDTRDTLLLSCGRTYSFETGFLAEGGAGGPCACGFGPGGPPEHPPVWYVPYPPLSYSPPTPTISTSWGRLKTLYR